MITQFDVEERAREWGLRDDIVEKDYVLGWVLWGIGSDERLAPYWVFKGGTCLKKCFLETYRFSEDLDFTVAPGGPIRKEELEPIVRDLLIRVQEESGIDFTGRPPKLETNEQHLYTRGRVYYRGPRGAPQVARIKLDLSSSERIVRKTIERTIAHPYPDELPEPGVVRCYSFEEVFAEKLRAMGERGRPRDLYDVVSLFRHGDLRGDPKEVQTVLHEKCMVKGVDVPTYASLEQATTRPELEAEWENMLAHQLPVLPPFEQFWGALPELFDWLEGRLVSEVREPIGITQDVTDWRPPPTMSMWKAPIPIEMIRFAAFNHLCVELGYNGRKRIVEPYSLRRTRVGNLLFYGLKASTGKTRCYRVDRIQSVRVTTEAFRPKHRIEFAPLGPISAPPTRSRRRFLRFRRHR